MNDLERISAELQQAIFDTLLPLQTTKDLALSAFERLENLAEELAAALRGSGEIPRVPVNALYCAAKAILAEAPYAKDPALVNEWASRLYMSFDLILLGESHADYKPGVPRVR